MAPGLVPAVRLEQEASGPILIIASTGMAQPVSTESRFGRVPGIGHLGFEPAFVQHPATDSDLHNLILCHAATAVVVGELSW